ncbi:oligosaccharide flippase family protein [Chryseobacterium indologenes]|uniref:oligosaccharide flippase family protein n=1 Tax=Chryseobacterium indologenes TaxID=253 RepID=UPI00257731F8|nr:oligosaccharide flippase family protein [Chryseobacterium indologenes]MDM1556711.1 oligosaccharide flippase family protein [Chryseobacterium indologenes]
MKERSLSVNYILSALRILTSAIVGLLIMSHANKVLGAVIIGKIEYASTIINYFIMFSALGIPMYGVREVAKQKKNKKELSKTLIELISILFVTTVISYLVLFTLLYGFDFFTEYKSLILLLSIIIFLTNAGADWFFVGMENQMYITVRFILIRLIALIILYLYVNSKDDDLIYVIVTILYLCGSNIFNFYFLYKNIQFNEVSFRELNFKRHIRPVMTIFIAAISVNIYLQLDSFLIGHIAGDKYLGYYAASNKLIRLATTFISVAGLVLIPRLSVYWDTDMNEYFNMLGKSFSLILTFFIPASLYFFIFARQVIMIMAGEDFYPAIFTMKLLAPICIIAGIVYFLGYLVLFIQKKEKIYTYAVILSAGFSVIVNLYAIREWQQNGAAVTQICAEILAIAFMLAFIWKELPRNLVFNRNLIKILLSSVMGVITVLVLRKLIDWEFNFFTFAAESIIFFLSIFVCLLLIKEKYVSEAFSMIIKRFKQIIK